MKRPEVRPEFPARYLSCDLVWWRSGHGFETLVSIYGGQWLSRLGTRAVDLHFVLVAAGGPQLAWTERLEYGGCTFASSKDLASRFGVRSRCDDGVLAIFAVDPEGRVQELDIDRCSLYPTVDWYSEDGSIATLHSDQTVQRPDFGGYGLTEIVVDPAFGAHSLVIVNGLQPQQSGCLSVRIVSQSGQAIERRFDRPMEPLSVNRFELGAERELKELAGGGVLFVSGRLDTRGLFSRPYVVSEKPQLGVYHAGDVYPRKSWTPLSRIYYDLLGCGESNPAMVEISDSMTTIANLFNSHGDLERDFDVDIRLYDEGGVLRADRRKAAAARRHGLDRIDLRELLPKGSSEFRGHAVFTFSRDPVAAAYPSHLQVLAEYRTAFSCSRVMLWSDDWNSPIRRKKAKGAVLRSYYRVWWSEMLQTKIAISNHGLPDKMGPYAVTAPYEIRLINARGEERSIHGALAPQATEIVELPEAFPGAVGHLEPEEYGMVVVDSPFDLAIIQMTRHRASGAIAAEHFMAAPTERNGGTIMPAGA